MNSTPGSVLGETSINFWLRTGDDQYIIKSFIGVLSYIGYVTNISNIIYLY
jgi:hypothetical protein